MKIYKDRFYNNYRKILHDSLKIDSLINSAETLSEPVIINKNKYTKMCSIDFTGLSSTTLLDIGGNFNRKNQETAKAFEETLRNLDKLNKEGIFLKIRFLFLYPFSHYSFSRIQAEYEDDRPVVSDNSNQAYSRDFNFMKQVDKSIFEKSNLVILSSGT